MIVEPSNDADYHDWLDANPSGLVLNSDKRRTNQNYPCCTEVFAPTSMTRTGRTIRLPIF